MYPFVKTVVDAYVCYLRNFEQKCFDQMLTNTNHQSKSEEIFM